MHVEIVVLHHTAIFVLGWCTNTIMAGKKSVTSEELNEILLNNDSDEDFILELESGDSVKANLRKWLWKVMCM